MPLQHPIRRTALALGLGLAATLAAAGPSGAESQIRQDPTQDVIKVIEGYPTVPGDTKTDIRTLKSSYGDGKVRMVLDLRRLAASNYQMRFRVTTPTQHWAVGYDVSSPDEPQVGLYEFNPRHALRGGPTPCEGLNHHQVADQDRIVINLPRACIDSPAWVRTGATVARFVDGAFHYDDARRNGSEAKPARLGPELDYN